MISDTTLPAGFKLKGGQRAYTIEEVLGQGGFGITYRAKGPVMAGSIKVMADFAVKEFFLKDDCERLDDSSISYSNPARTRVENARKDFLKEALRLRKLGFSHHNIVGFDEVFEANNTAYYVMEYLKGESLDSYIKSRGALSEAEAEKLMQPILDAVRMLHNQSLCHLDIKPANIMLTTDEDGKTRPVLIDFGLSKHFDNEGHATSTINTFGYSEGYAPIEQYRGITTFSPGADIYALGATYYFILTGKTPPASIELTDGELASTLPPTVSSTLCRRIELMTLNHRSRPKSLDEVDRQANEATTQQPSGTQTSIVAGAVPTPAPQPKPQPVENIKETVVIENHGNKSSQKDIKKLAIAIIIVAILAIGIVIFSNTRLSDNDIEPIAPEDTIPAVEEVQPTPDSPTQSQVTPASKTETPVTPASTQPTNVKPQNSNSRPIKPSKSSTPSSNTTPAKTTKPFDNTIPADNTTPAQTTNSAAGTPAAKTEPDVTTPSTNSANRPKKVADF